MKKTTTAIILSLLLVQFFIVTDSVSSEENIENIVDSTINIEMPSATDYKISISMDVKQIKVFGNIYKSNEIQSLASSSDTNDIEDMGAIKLALSQLIEEQITSSFEDAEISESIKPSYSSGLFNCEYDVNLTSPFFGLNETIKSHDFINGILDMSAKVNYTFNLKAEEGWNNSYIFNLGEKLGYQWTNGKVTNKKIRWNVFNGMGEQPNKKATLTLIKSNPTSEPKSEKIYLLFTLDTKRGETSLKSSIYADTLDIRKYNVLPDFITNLNYLSSDGVRLFVDNKIIDWNETIYKKTLQPIQNKIKENIEKSEFNQSINFDFSWDQDSTIECKEPFDLEKMDENPPVIANLVDSPVDLRIAGISEKAIFGFLNTGADANISKKDINFGKNLENLNYPYNITILFPKNISIKNQNTYTWNNTINFEGALKSKRDPDYKEEEISKTIEINFKNSDLNLLGFFTSNPELNFDIEIKQNKDLNVTKIPDEFSIPEEISIEYLNSDLIRLCIQEDVFKENEVNNYLKNEKEIFENDISSIIKDLKISGKINRDSFNKNVQKYVNISEIDKYPSLKTEMSSNTIHPIKFNFSILPPDFEIPIQKYEFTGIKNQSVTYKMVFPKGIDIDAQDTLSRVNIYENKNKQKVLEISFNSDESDLNSIASVKMKPSTLYLFGIFMPCIISFIIVVILIIVIFILRRRRKYKKPTGVYEEPSKEEDTSYQEEDYYVPPPPGSK